MDRLTSMSVFVVAATEGSLMASARHHGLSSSMAGKHVAAIEAQLNVRLMQRTTRSLVLTEAGRAYYARCKRILDEFEEAKREASDVRGKVRGVLRVAAPVTYGALHLSGVMGSFLERFPGVTLDVILSDRYVDLVAEGIDVAVRIGKLQDSNLIAKRLAPCRMVVCASTRFVEQAGPLQTIVELRRQPRLAFSDAVSPGDWTVTDPRGNTHVIDGPIRMTANNMQMLLAAALDGRGITYGPSFVFDEHLESGDLVALLPNYKTTELAIHAVYPSNRHVPMKLRKFVDHLSASLTSDTRTGHSVRIQRPYGN